MKKNVLKYILKDMKEHCRSVAILELSEAEIKHKVNAKQIFDTIDSYNLGTGIYVKDDNTYLLIIFDKTFSMYNEVLKRAVKSGDKVLLQYVISSIGKFDEFAMKIFIEKCIDKETEVNRKTAKETTDKVIKDDLETLDKEEKDISSKTINDDIAKKIVKKELENRISDCELIINYVTDVKKSVLNRQFKDEFIWHHHPVIKTEYYADKLATFNHTIHDIIISNDNPMAMKNAEHYCDVIIKERADERYDYIGILSSNAKIRYTCYKC